MVFVLDQYIRLICISRREIGIKNKNGNRQLLLRIFPVHFNFACLLFCERYA